MKHHTIDDYLMKKVVPFNVNNVKTVENLLEGLRFCGFQGGNLGKALEILEKMVSEKECLTVLALSGAMVPAGMGGLISILMEYNLIDVIITTGANISHDLVDAIFDVGHYIGSPDVDDNELYKLKINRIYDIFLPDENFTIAEKKLLDILKEVFKDRNVDVSPSEFLKKVGEKITQRCILSTAAKYNIPIFVPAITDSELSLNLAKLTVTEGFNINFNVLEDLKKFASIMRNSKEAGIIIIGGGVPRNWAQQVFPYLDNLDKLREQGIKSGYKYSVRIHTATEYDGGLSGCTFSESKSWGKYLINSQYVSVWCDATIAFPLLITALLQRLKII